MYMYLQLSAIITLSVISKTLAIGTPYEGVPIARILEINILEISIFEIDIDRLHDIAHL